MFSKIFINCLLCFLYHTSANAASQTLIISGGYGPDLDDPWYRTISKIGFETESARGRNVYVAAKDGKWDFPLSGKQFPARDVSDIEQAIKAAASNLKSGDSFFLFVTDHGGAPSSESNPLSSKIVLWGPDAWTMPAMTHNKLLMLLKKYIPNNVSIKLVGTHCFSGGLHNVAFALSNACAAANTDFRTVSITEYEKDRTYSYGLWQEIRERRFDLDHDNKTSLQEAHLDAVITDTGNEGRPDISSSAYVDFILKDGPYKNVSSPLRRLLFIPPSESLITRKLNEVDYSPKICAINIPTVASELGSLAAIILPLVSGSVYDFALNDWKENGSNYIIKLKENRNQHMKLVGEWNSFNTSDKTKKRAEYTEKFNQFRKKANRELAKLLAISHLIENKEKIGRFLKVATPEQKRKFAQLLKCEALPL